MCQTGDNCSDIATCDFQKSQKLLTDRAPRQAAFSEHSISIHSISMVGYVIIVPAFVCGVRPGR